MKQHLIKNCVLAGVALLAVPSVLTAQNVKEKEKKGQAQTIVITRTGDIKAKSVIEIDGDKVTVDGKDAKDLKDVNISVNTTSGGKHRMVYAPGQAMTFNFDGDKMDLFEEDENRAMLGVTTEGDDKGAEIKSVTTGSAAEKAGLKRGDIITKIGDKKIEDSDDVTAAVRSHKPGDKVTVVYLRDDKEAKATAELGKWKGVRMNAFSMPRTPMAPMAPMTPDWNEEFRSNMDEFRRDMAIGGFGGTHAASGRPRLGLSIQDDEDGKGAKVLDVDDESAAEKAGLKEGDIITGIDDQQVKGTDDVTRTIRANREKYNFSFKVLRDGKPQTLEVKMPRKLKQAEL